MLRYFIFLFPQFFFSVDVISLTSQIRVKIPYRNPHQLNQDSTPALYPVCFVSSTCSCCTGSMDPLPQSCP